MDISLGQYVHLWERRRWIFLVLVPFLLTDFRHCGKRNYPKTQWKSLRSTNVIERVNLEFRRRVKTQGSLPTEDSVLILLFALYASGQITMTRLVGFKDLDSVTEKNNLKVVA